MSLGNALQFSSKRRTSKREQSAITPLLRADSFKFQQKGLFKFT
jgi:hypothetical protein